MVVDHDCTMSRPKRRLLALCILLALLVAVSSGCSGTTECEDSGKPCRARGTWQTCTVKNFGGFCTARYFIGPDGTQIDCNGCDCNQVTIALYCANLDGDPGKLIDASPYPELDADAGDAALDEGTDGG
jgi:hypothetical protein